MSAKTAKPKIKKKSIVFVCTGNTCRSPMAEYIFKAALKKKNLAELYTVTSSGVAADVGSDMTAEARTALKLLGIPARKHKSKQTTVQTVKKAHLIICMTDRHKAAIVDACPECSEKCFTLGSFTGGGDVIDPYGGTVEKYTKTAQCLIYAADEIITYLEKQNSKTN